uniref:Uncharacterized protein n=1 Tax=Arundo donax TaxID=35708 RepID=A0A0A9CBH9_ARUDO
MGGSNSSMRPKANRTTLGLLRWISFLNYRD